jgi:ribonucleoside-diphosphate reductase alpha chain
MLSEIARTQLESGYPYMMYIDNSNDQNPLKDVGRIYMSNLCTEILQIQTLSDIQGYAGKDTIGEDVNCNLGSLNITNVMEKKMLKESVFLGMDALTVVAEETSIDAVPTVKKGNESFHSVGLGAMNLHGYLAKNHIVYTSDIAKDFVNTFFMTMNFYSLQRSMEIAKERGVSFKGFEKSEYANGRYFDKYITTCFQPKTDRVKELFEGQYIPTMEDWKQLKEDVMKYGVFHSYRQAIAPTQSISYVQNATSALMPITQQIETRTYGDSTTHYPMPYMTNQNIHFYQPAYEMNMYKYLDLMAVAQQHIDQGISTILFVNSDTTTRELARLYVYANKIGLKTLYYTRTRKLTLEECESCAV